MNAWQLLQFDGVLLSDTDVVFRADPAPWMQARLEEDEYFHAEREKGKRNYMGVNSHIVWLRPNRYVHRMLVDAAQRGNYVPFTNGEQDIIESLFTPHRDELQIPASAHSKFAFCTCRSMVVLYQANFSIGWTGLVPKWADASQGVRVSLAVNNQIPSFVQWTQLRESTSMDFMLWRVADLSPDALSACPHEARLVQLKSKRCYDERHHVRLGDVQLIRVSDWRRAQLVKAAAKRSEASVVRV